MDQPPALPARAGPAAVAAMVEAASCVAFADTAGGEEPHCVAPSSPMGSGGHRPAALQRLLTVVDPDASPVFGTVGLRSCLSNSGMEGELDAAEGSLVPCVVSRNEQSAQSRPGVTVLHAPWAVQEPDAAERALDEQLAEDLVEVPCVFVDECVGQCIEKFVDLASTQAVGGDCRTSLEHEVKSVAEVAGRRVREFVEERLALLEERIEAIAAEAAEERFLRERCSDMVAERLETISKLVSSVAVETEAASRTSIDMPPPLQPCLEEDTRTRSLEDRCEALISAQLASAQDLEAAETALRSVSSEVAAVCETHWQHILKVADNMTALGKEITTRIDRLEVACGVAESLDQHKLAITPVSHTPVATPSSSLPIGGAPTVKFAFPTVATSTPHSPGKPTLQFSPAPLTPTADTCRASVLEATSVSSPELADGAYRRRTQSSSPVGVRRAAACVRSLHLRDAAAAIGCLQARSARSQSPLPQRRAVSPLRQMNMLTPQAYEREFGTMCTVPATGLGPAGTPAATPLQTPMLGAFSSARAAAVPSVPNSGIVSSLGFCLTERGGSFTLPIPRPSVQQQLCDASAAAGALAAPSALMSMSASASTCTSAAWAPAGPTRGPPSCLSKTRRASPRRESQPRPVSCERNPTVDTPERALPRRLFRCLVSNSVGLSLDAGC